MGRWQFGLFDIVGAQYTAPLLCVCNLAFMTHDSSKIPPAPWILHGESIAFLHRDENGQIGVRAFVHYTDSPVGAYNEMAFAILTSRGVRVTQMPVTLEESMIGGRAIWGFPKTLEHIEYSMLRNRVCVRFRNTSIRARVSRFSFPLKLRAWTIQTMDGANVRVPIAIRGRVFFAWRGRQLGACLRDFELTVWVPEKLS